MVLAFQFLSAKTEIENKVNIIKSKKLLKEIEKNYVENELFDKNDIKQLK